MSYGKLAPLNRSNTGGEPAYPRAYNPFANPGQQADAIPDLATAYAYTRTPMSSPYRPEQGVQIGSRSAAVDRRERQVGYRHNYVHGDENMGQNIALHFKATGQDESSMFQPVNTRLWYWFQNLAWYICYPAATVMNGGDHNLAWSVKVDQLPTQKTGGPTTNRMNSKPAFVKVQQIRRYSSVPGTYNTTSSPS